MTIRMLQAWNGLHQQKIVTTLSGSDEAALVAAGIATYDLDGPAENLRMAQLATDAGGNAIGFTAGNSVVSRVSLLGGHVWVAGDSTAMFAQEATSADINAADSQCAFTHLNSLLGGTLLQVGNSAVSGVDTGHVISTQIPAIKSAISGGEKVDFVYLQITANDFYHSSYLRTAAYVKANILRILRDFAD